MEHEDWIRLYVVEGKTQKQIAKKVGMSIAWVRQRLKEHGIGRWERGGKRNEHRYTLERHLKRRLTKGEEVHHINFDHTDNRIENLFLTNKKEHGKITHSFYSLFRELFNLGIIQFDKDKKKYFITEEYKKR